MQNNKHYVTKPNNIIIDKRNSGNVRDVTGAENHLLKDDRNLGHIWSPGLHSLFVSETRVISQCTTMIHYILIMSYPILEIVRCVNFRNTASIYHLQLNK